MSKERKKEQKKKTRTKEKRQDLLTKRAVATAKRQEEKAEFSEEKNMRRGIREEKKVKTWADGFVQDLEKMPEDTKKQILHNIEVLKALEEEYQKND